MASLDPSTLSATAAAGAIARGAVTSGDLVGACLARIAARNPVAQAWSALDAEAALAQARVSDTGPRRGALHGVPVGITDVLNTYDLPTRMGSPIYADHRPMDDASCAALLRAAGAIVLGKTVTCECAGVAPGPNKALFACALWLQHAASVLLEAAL